MSEETANETANLSESGGWRDVGPGEALFWIAGYAVIQFAVVCLVLALIAFSALGLSSLSPQRMLDLFMAIELDRSFLVIGASTLGSVLVLVPLVRWRLGPEWRFRIGLTSMRRQDGLLIAGAVVPLAILSNELYRWSQAWFGLAVDTNQHVQALATGVSYPILVMAIALGPALGEELVFRGLIGQGMVRRWGTVGGVLATTVLFGLMHMPPAHALATLPIGLFLHGVYLQTRTLWVPILLHFLNNLLVVTLAHFQHQGLPTSPVLLATAFACLTSLAWRMGTHHDSDGPTLTGPFCRQWQRAYEGCSFLGYTAAFVWSAGAR
ncbi:MAG: CPBP family intramembrane metalloprotease [Planctomycetota bacterium]|nr:MAG: CPBP family intramembrane metalloprotease [Planctomycetota bacterium]